MSLRRHCSIAPIFAATVLFGGCTSVPPTDPRMVSEWAHTLYGAIRVERLSPPVASRLMGYASVALYSGVASAGHTLPSLAGVLNGLAEKSLPRAERGRSYDGTIAAVTAERVVLDSLLGEALPTTRAAVARLADSLTRSRIATGLSDRVRARSDTLGRGVGLAIVAWSRSDGFDATRGRPYVAPLGLGLWINDSPASTYATQNLSGASEFVSFDNPANQQRAGNVSDRGMILSRPKRSGANTLPAANMAGATEPYWGSVRPFALTRWNECALPSPPTYATDTQSVIYRDARIVRETRIHITAEQRTIALYWADNPGESGTPVGHWLSIASQMVSERHLSAEAAARLMVLTAVAQVDAFIAAWGYKYQYNLIRPRTYIRRVIDPAYEPLIATPPFPEYPAGHSTQSAAAAAVLTALLGETAFSDSTSISIGHAVRRFDSFNAAADEAGISRIYAGIHFPYGNNAGKALGRCVGAKVIERFSTAVTL